LIKKIKAKLLELNHKKSVPAVAGRVVDALALVKPPIRRIPNYRAFLKLLQDAIANYNTNFVHLVLT
jgi:hypothetical protein